VSDELANYVWVRDITGELSVDSMVQFLKLWMALCDVPLGEGADGFTWKWMENGVFTTKSAYCVFFQSTTALPGAAEVWNSFAPFKFRFHTWFLLHRRC
jgi:hypothetical protein